MIKFSQRAVAFLDVLGFSALVQQAETNTTALNKLGGLLTMMDTHVRLDKSSVHGSVPAKVIPKYLIISDSLIISAPLRHGKYEGLGIVVLKAIQVSIKLLAAGYLVRGGISIGPTYHTPRNIVGSGYIQAYRTELSASHPRILLDQAARAYWQSNSKLSSTTICINEGVDVIADLLHVAYIPNNTSHGAIEETYKQIACQIGQGLRASSGKPEWDKWNYMRNFLELAKQRHSVTLNFKVPPY
jgi:hypothetical protein